MSVQMRYRDATLLAAGLKTVLLQARGAATEPKIIAIKAQCVDAPSCTFRRSDMRIDVVVKDVGSQEIGFPAEYIQERGPSMRLIDNVTQESQQLQVKRPRASREKLMRLQPGQSFTINTVIKDRENLRVRREFVDVTAELNVSAEIQVGSSEARVRTSDSQRIRIVSMDTLERDAKLGL